MITSFHNKDLYPILEAYQYVCENAEGKNINKSEAYIKKFHSDIIGKTLPDGRIINPRILTQEIRNAVPNSRLANCKFLLGVTRIFFNDIGHDNDAQSKLNKLNQFIKIIASDAHVNEYDNNINNLSFYQIEEKFASSVKSNIEDDKNKISSKIYNKNSDYTIIKILSYKEAQKYSKYTSWCVTHYESMFDNYTKGGLGVFYFCLRNGFENEPKIVKNGCPLDDYGKSMIAISVNDDGSLNTCTCRWNHDNGGNDSIMSTAEISDFFGVNFYETFKPRSIDEIWETYNEMTYGYDEVSVALGAKKIKEPDNTIKYIIKEENCIKKYSLVGRYDKQFNHIWSESIQVEEYKCIAHDRLYWFNRSGIEIDAPEIVHGDICVRASDDLISLKGCPKNLRGDLGLYDCHRLKDLKDCPEFLHGIFINNCSSLTNLNGIGICSDFIDIRDCQNLSSLYGNKNEHIRILRFSGCKNLSSLEFAPKYVTGKFDLSYCRALSSLNNAPIIFNGNYNFNESGIEPYKISNYIEFNECYEYHKNDAEGVSIVIRDSEGSTFRSDIKDLISETGHYKEII